MTPDLPKGYIGSLPDSSVFVQDGRNVYRCAAGNVVDTRTGYLQGRWECTLIHWNRSAHALYDLPAVPEAVPGVSAVTTVRQSPRRSL